MRIKLLIALLLTLTIDIVYGQEKHTRKRYSDYCVKTKNLSYSRIVKLYPYNQAATIELVSFISDQEIVLEIPKSGDSVDLNKLHERKMLNQEQREVLLDLLVNYFYDNKLKENIIETGACYLPRNAIIFFNNQQQPIAYIEICFECLAYKSAPENIKMGDFCFEKYDLMKKLFQKAGVMYGITTL